MKQKSTAANKTDEIWETKSNNQGLLLVETEYVSIVQDDMLIKHKDWDLKLSKQKY